MTVQTGTMWLVIIGMVLGRLIVTAFAPSEPSIAREPSQSTVVTGDFLGIVPKENDATRGDFLARWVEPVTVAVAPPVTPREEWSLPIEPFIGSGADGGAAAVTVLPKPRKSESTRKPNTLERVRVQVHPHELCAARHMRRENYTNEKGWRYWRCVKA